MSGAASASDVPALLRALVADATGAPRVTWYGDGGERVELSSRVLENWVAKTCWLLDELGVDEDSSLGVALPPHWRTACWLLAAWATGARVVTGDGAAAADAVVSSDADVLASASGTALAVALPALATRWPGALPAGAVDAAADLRGQPDAMPDLRGGAEELVRARLAAADAALAPGARVLAPGRPERAVEELLAPLSVGGSVVLAAPGHDAQHLLAVERATLLGG